MGKKPEHKNIISEQEKEDNYKQEPFSENVLEYSKKQVLFLDKDFDFNSFLDNAKSAFTFIITSYKKHNLNEVKPYLSSEVYAAFVKSITTENKKNDMFKIGALKATIIQIEVIKKIVKIKVEFLSKQVETHENETKPNEIKDIWTFEKEITDKNPIWILTKVHLE